MRSYNHYKINFYNIHKEEAQPFPKWKQFNKKDTPLTQGTLKTAISSSLGSTPLPWGTLNTSFFLFIMMRNNPSYEGNTRF